MHVRAQKPLCAIEPERHGHVTYAGSRRGECQEAGIRGYPTWQLDGKLFPVRSCSISCARELMAHARAADVCASRVRQGERSLDELEAILQGKAEPDELPS